MDDPAIVSRLRSAAEAVARLKVERAESEKAAGMASHSGGGIADRVVLVGKLADHMVSLQGQELADLRTLLAQELRRTLSSLRFSPWNILADYRVDVRRTPSLAWTQGVPLLQSDEDRDHWAEQAEIDTAFDGQPRMGIRRLPPSARTG